MTTFAESPTAAAILFARVLNAPHCLQASMLTIFWLFPAATFAELLFFGDAFFGLGDVAFAFLEGAAFLTTAFLAAGSLALPEEERVVRTIMWL